MKVCGIEICGSEARIAIIEGDDESCVCVGSEPRKVQLDDDESSDRIRSFSEVFQSLVRDQRIEHLGIKKRNKKGEYAGGPISFKIEGVLQLLNGCQVHLLASTTIAAVVKRKAIEKPASLRKYQKAAFETAIALMHRLQNG